MGWRGIADVVEPGAPPHSVGLPQAPAAHAVAGRLAGSFARPKAAENLLRGLGLRDNRALGGGCQG